jgi:hypothetical protein
LLILATALCLWGPPPIKLIKQHGATCLPASAAMVLGSLGQPISARQLAKELPMYGDGTGFFDLQNELQRRGFRAHVFQGGRDELRAALGAGLAMIVALGDGAGRHAVVIAALTGCGAANERFELLDPRGPSRRKVSAAELEQQLSANQMLLVFRASHRPALAREKFPLELTAQHNRRFRASAWLRRAARHKRPNAQSLELVRRAVVEYPCWSKVQTALRENLRALKLPKEQAPTACGGGQ